MSKSDISHCPIQQRDSIGYESNTRAPNVTGFEDIPLASTAEVGFILLDHVHA